MICENTKCPYWKAFDYHCPAADGCAGFSSLIENNKRIIDGLGVKCKDSRIGTHLCNVKTRYGWCCDVCLEPELLYLKSVCVHTVNSCCGHGNKKLASILVAGKSSAEKMKTMGYQIGENYKDETGRYVSFYPKTVFEYETLKGADKK